MSEESTGAQAVTEEVKSGEVEVTEEVIDEKPESRKIEKLDDALKEIEKLRRENASKRVKAKETEEKAQKWEEYMDAQKSEYEKLTEQYESLRAEKAQLEVERIQEKLLREFDLDDDLAEFITGADEKEMRKRAEKLAEKAVTKSANSAADLGAGKGRGRPVTPQNGSGGGFLEYLDEHKEYR